MRARRGVMTMLGCLLLTACGPGGLPSDGLPPPNTADPDFGVVDDGAGDRATDGSDAATTDPPVDEGDAPADAMDPPADGGDPPDDVDPADPPSVRAPTSSDGTLLFGLGPTADSAAGSSLADRAPLDMVTTWYNGPGDLSWLRPWKDSLIPQLWAEGYAHHLIVFSDDAEGGIDGAGCGRGYPVSDGFLDDVRELADVFAGDAPLYVTMFTELQTYPCTDNQWAGNEAYFAALKDNYLAAMDIFHAANPQASVALGWGGWQARWDDPATGAGRSLIGHFDDVMRRSDHQAFQAMATDSNIDDMRAMTGLLAPYGPVMLAHYKPDNGDPAVFDADMAALFGDGVIEELTAAGLFGFSFMDDAVFAGDTARLQRVADAVGAYSE